MGITYGDYLIDSGYYDPKEEEMSETKDFDQRMVRASWCLAVVVLLALWARSMGLGS